MIQLVIYNRAVNRVNISSPARKMFYSALPVWPEILYGIWMGVVKMARELNEILVKYTYTVVCNFLLHISK